jgi:hypothetical protein
MTDHAAAFVWLKETLAEIDAEYVVRDYTSASIDPQTWASLAMKRHFVRVDNPKVIDVVFHDASSRHEQVEFKVTLAGHDILIYNKDNYFSFSTSHWTKEKIRHVLSGPMLCVACNEEPVQTMSCRACKDYICLPCAISLVDERSGMWTCPVQRCQVINPDPTPSGGITDIRDVMNCTYDEMFQRVREAMRPIMRDVKRASDKKKEKMRKNKERKKAKKRQARAEAQHQSGAAAEEETITEIALEPEPESVDVMQQEGDGDVDIDVCSICDVDLVYAEVTVTRCNHSFHRTCIDTWTSVCTENKWDVTCPMCRGILQDCDV